MGYHAKSLTIDTICVDDTILSLCLLTLPLSFLSQLLLLLLLPSLSASRVRPSSVLPCLLALHFFMHAMTTIPATTTTDPTDITTFSQCIGFLDPCNALATVYCDEEPCNIGAYCESCAQSIHEVERFAKHTLCRRTQIMQCEFRNKSPRCSQIAAVHCPQCHGIQTCQPCFEAYHRLRSHHQPIIMDLKDHFPITTTNNPPVATETPLPVDDTAQQHDYRDTTTSKHTQITRVPVHFVRETGTGQLLGELNITSNSDEDESLVSTGGGGRETPRTARQFKTYFNIPSDHTTSPQSENCPVFAPPLNLPFTEDPVSTAEQLSQNAFSPQQQTTAAVVAPQEKVAATPLMTPKRNDHDPSANVTSFLSSFSKESGVALHLSGDPLPSVMASTKKSAEKRSMTGSHAARKR